MKNISFTPEILDIGFINFQGFESGDVVCNKRMAFFVVRHQEDELLVVLNKVSGLERNLVIMDFMS